MNHCSELASVLWIRSRRKAVAKQRWRRGTKRLYPDDHDPTRAGTRAKQRSSTVAKHGCGSNDVSGRRGGRVQQLLQIVFRNFGEICVFPQNLCKNFCKIHVNW